MSRKRALWMVMASAPNWPLAASSLRNAGRSGWVNTAVAPSHGSPCGCPWRRGHRQRPALIDGHGGQIDAIGDITNGINVRNVGALIGINSNAMPVVGNAAFSVPAVPERLCGRRLAGPHQLRSGISAAQHHAAVGLLDGEGCKPKRSVMPSLPCPRAPHQRVLDRNL